MTYRNYRSFRPGDRPQLEVNIGTRWYPGELLAWLWRQDQWLAHISYVVDGSSHKATLAAHQTRSEDPRAHDPALLTERPSNLVPQLENLP